MLLARNQSLSIQSLDTCMFHCIKTIFMICCHLSLSNYILSSFAAFFSLRLLTRVCIGTPNYYACFEYVGKAVEEQWVSWSIQVYHKILPVEMESYQKTVKSQQAMINSLVCRITHLRSWTLPVMHYISSSVNDTSSEGSWSNSRNDERNSPLFWCIPVG